MHAQCSNNWVVNNNFAVRFQPQIYSIWWYTTEYCNTCWGHTCMHNVHIHIYVHMSDFTNVGSGAAEQLLGNRAVGQALDGVCVSVLQNALHWLSIPNDDCSVSTTWCKPSAWRQHKQMCMYMYMIIYIGHIHTEDDNCKGLEPYFTSSKVHIYVSHRLCYRRDSRQDLCAPWECATDCHHCCHTPRGRREDINCPR